MLRCLAPCREPCRRRGTVPAHPTLLVLLPLLALALLALPPLVPAPAAKATDVFVSNCSQIPDPPPNGFLRWSDPGTWTPLGFTGVPGVGALVNANVTIPCSMAVLLDSAVPMLNLTVLQIQGFLKVEDPATPRVYQVFACFVMVEGQLSIGSAANQFKSKITFTLMPNPNNRLPWAGSFVWPAEPAFPRSMGHKPFAVMGGQVHLHGMPGGGATPSWVKLNVSARVGDFQIVVDTDVSQLWPVGSRIAVASTDAAPDQAEPFLITGYDTDPRGTIITLNNRITWNHYGDPFGIPDGFGGFIDERAEVALLSRNIIITGLDEPGTFLLEGGHFIVFMTSVPQFIEGVEFFQMGQQGTLGRYNIHFHVCGDDRGRSVVRKNAMHNSKQRCVVIHATHNVTIDSNVAYNTSGHCYLIEEGGEMGNTFINNLGIWQRAVSQRIALDESDNSPATFWITNMNNNYINNVGAGSENSAFWTELLGNVRGMSLSIPKLAGIVPRWTPFGIYQGNVGHSNRGFGWQFYPHGVDPHTIYDFNASTLGQWQWPNTRGYVYGLTLYKNGYTGLFMHNSANVFLVNVTAADQNWGIELNSNYGGGVSNSTFLSLSNNLGTPNSYWCSGQDPVWVMMCMPVSGCSLTPDPRQWRARIWSHWQSPQFGIHMDSPSTWADGGGAAYTFANNRFSGYVPQCGRVAAAIGTGISGNNRQWFTSATNTAGMMLNPSTSPGFWIAPQDWNWPAVPGNPANVAPYWDVVHATAVYDKDGSLVGGTGGFVISNTPGMLPPLSRYSCTLRTDMNAYLCPNTCYRTLQFAYNEDGFTPVGRDGPRRNRTDVSYLVVRRIEDNVTHVLDGNGNTTDTGIGTIRSFWVSVLAPATYEVSIVLPTNKMFWPSNFTVKVQDGNVCAAPVTLRILPIPTTQWALSTDSNCFWSQCPGTTFTGNSTAWPVQYQYVCHKQRQVLQLTILPNFNVANSIFLVSSGQRVMPCRLPLRCGVWTTNDWYYFNASGREVRAPKPGAMGYAVPGFNHSSWAYGQGMIGNSGWGWDQVKALTPLMNATNGFTFFYRKSFTVSNSACYSGIFLDIIPYQGLIAFLNNVEVFRWNLPAGNITNNTQSSTNPPWPNPWMNTTFINITAANASFVEGTNWLAFENHGVSIYWSASYFDTRVSLLSNSLACTGASVMPEVCDGLDNNFDGLVDIDPATGRVFTRPCWTRCGSGIETCINGAFQNCTAPPSLKEKCNGRDDDCDGLIDNGVVGTQLDCARGSVCFQGQCLPQGPLTVPAPVFPRSTGGWYYLDQGWPWQTYPNWLNGRFSSNPNDTTIRQFKANGVAPFGTSNYSWPINTTLTQNSNGDIYYYFLKSFNLTATEAANTYSLSVNAKRDNAAVVWSNGVEIMRSNFPASFTPSAQTTVYASQAGTCPACWWPNNATRSTGASSGAARAGVNWVAAQVAQSQWYPQYIHFDMELVRNVNQSCSALQGAPAACVRNPPNDTTFFQFGSTWKFLDLNYSLPPNTWIERSFDDSLWPSGPGPLGGPTAQWWIPTRLNMNRTLRQAYYFRRTFSAQDASCHYSLNLQLLALDGAVVYVNGVEAFRFQWEPQWVQPTDFANTYWPPTDKQNFTLSTGWIVNGNNVIAAEIHPSSQNTNNWYFDLALTGQREGVNCSPLPP